MSTFESDITLEYYDSVHACSEVWDSIGDNNLYWKSKYLKVLEKYPAKNMSHIYVLVKRKNTLIAKFLFQNIYIQLSKSYGEHNHKLRFSQKVKEGAKKLILPFLNFQLIVSGNALLTGNYGHFFSPGIELKEQVDIVSNVTEEYRKYFSKNFKKPSGILLKDIKKDIDVYSNVLGQNQFSNFQVEPKMKMKIDPTWNSFDDYLSAIKSKYRVRVRRAKKKLGDITHRKLEGEEIQQYAAKMYALYMETAGGAGFNLFFLDDYYFAGMALELPQDVRLVGVFRGEEMLGFYTLIKAGTELDAHFLGYSIKHNQEHQIYLNMLYFMIEDAIEANATMLHMSRTALEIKSSVGARPQQLELYVKHYSKPLNAIVKQLLKITVPEVKWLERSPFK